MKVYEYTTGYLIEEEAKDINLVTGMMNVFGTEGWHFTGYAKEVLNGTFYFFARVKAVVA
jgi:hypothetical protein